MHDAARTINDIWIDSARSTKVAQQQNSFGGTNSSQSLLLGRTMEQSQVEGTGFENG